MEQNTIQQEQSAKQMAALHVINDKYRKVITSDAIVQQDVEELMKYLRTSDPSSGRHCEKIIDHLLAEIHESAEDEQRMDNEGPTFQNAQNTNNAQDYFLFKDAMADFYQHHIKQSTSPL